MKKSLAILQARTSSARLPGKVLLPINQKPVLLWQIERIKRCTQIDLLVIATSVDESDDNLVRILESAGQIVIRGSLENVLSRFTTVANKFREYETLIRLTGDCPLFMPKLCDEMIKRFHTKDVDYLSNIISPTYPDGCDIEIFERNALMEVGVLANSPQEFEHVTLGIYKRPAKFKLFNFENNVDDSRYRWTLDETKDLEFIKNVFLYFKGREADFDYEELKSAIELGVIEGRYDDSRRRSKFMKGQSE